ncbi:hypothetical protein C882_1387 [Caenispirillum salinarum AK4]|uniref:Uncharacterized protein n=1 Tax=Caenispirillum salinarum AK4 TaxID=1238182 RepID=K9HFY2_9PROT|nr:hypothetical protein [Caenispirillum salinarum]EKV27541.1 hypothetical protein C882_1387 [Caenispirillum salinarum AK4]
MSPARNTAQAKPAKAPSGGRPSSASAGSERRACPELRQRAQKGYEALFKLLEKAGRQDFIQSLGERRRVDDVLGDLPETVPALLNMVWELRESPQFRPFFLAKDGGGEAVVQDRQTPIAPCGRTYNEVMRAHLMGATRIYLDRMERAWAEKEAKREAKRHAKEEAQERKSIGGRISVATRKLISGEKTFDAREFREYYPGHGVYLIIKPHLREEWQFSMVRAYARLRAAQAEALGGLLRFFRTPEELEPVLALKSADISVLRGVSRAYAETRLGVPVAKPGQRGKITQAQQRKLDEMEPEIAALESRTFESLVTEHATGLKEVLKQGANVDATIRRLTPIFGDGLWTLFDEPERLRNVMNVPEHVAPALGHLTQHIPPPVSRVLEQINNRELGRDIMVFAAEEFPDEETFARICNDPKRLKIWQTIPAKFNNSFNYQADAQSGQGSIKNAEDLRMVCAGLFESLRKGELEKLG